MRREKRGDKKKKIRGFWASYVAEIHLPQRRSGIQNLYFLWALQGLFFHFCIFLLSFTFFYIPSQCCIYLVSIYPIARLSGNKSTSSTRTFLILIPKAFFFFLSTRLCLPFYSTALQYFYGIGEPTAMKLCDQLAIPKNIKIAELNETQINNLTNTLAGMTIETDLKRQIREQVMHHRNINDYVGRRHAMSLPVRGQRTRNNAKSAKKLNGRWVQRRGFTS
jgi:small subunit ribosomal protein S13